MLSVDPLPPLRPSSRQPLSLRDLLSLVTLLCATLVLLGLPNWGEEERWLIGPAVLATLLGILAGRALKWPAWPLGFLVGTAGAALGTWLNCRWLSENCNWYPSRELCIAAKQAISGTAWLGGAVAIAIVLATIVAFGLLQWLTSTHSRGVIPLLRIYPRRGAVVVALVAILMWCITHSDFIYWPRAWPVRCAVPYQRDGERLPTDGPVELALSHDGHYVAVSFFLRSYQSFAAVYDVARIPHRLTVPGLDPNERYEVAFDLDSDRLALLQGHTATAIFLGGGQEPFQVSVVDVRTNEKWPISTDLRSARGRLQWVRPGVLALYRPDDEIRPVMVNVDAGRNMKSNDDSTEQATSGHIDGVITRTRRLANSQTVVYFEPRLLHEYRLQVKPHQDPDAANEYTDLRVYHLATQELLFTIPLPPLPDQFEKVSASPDGRFLLHLPIGWWEKSLYDSTEKTVQSFPGTLWSFNSRSQMFRSTADLERGLTPHTWLDFVPLVRCINSWRQRDYISLLDPATGREVARTQPISPCILNVVLSHDGSTMAVATWEGVYLFDVPKEFR